MKVDGRLGSGLIGNISKYENENEDYSTGVYGGDVEIDKIFKTLDHVAARQKGEPWTKEKIEREIKKELEKDPDAVVGTVTLKRWFPTEEKKPGLPGTLSKSGQSNAE